MNYPELADDLRMHRAETEAQVPTLTLTYLSLKAADQTAGR